MVSKRAVLLVLLTAFAVFSQEINIRGTVTDTSGVMAIAGAVVKLEKRGYADTTAADGSFTLAGAISIGSNIQQLQPNALSANLRNGMLSLYLPERSAVAVTTYTMQGKAVVKVQKVLDMGTHIIAQPSVGRGVYVYKIRAGSRELVLKSSFHGRTGGAFALHAPTTKTVSSESRYAPIDDVIFASKEGLLNYRVMVKKTDTSGIKIKMIPNAGNLTDADGNVYQSVRIGNQVWAVENLRVTKYNDGTAIPHVTDSAQWTVDTTPGYCYYNNATNADTIKKWGALYNWYVVSPTNPKQIAPAGWRVPADTDWKVLEKYLVLNGYNWDGTTDTSTWPYNKIAKSLAAKTDWNIDTTTGTIGCNLSTNNSSGFSALPGGGRTSDGNFLVKSYSGVWWSATEGVSDAWYRNLYHEELVYLNRGSESKSCGFSVRLLRD